MECIHEMLVEWCATCNNIKDSKEEQKELDRQFLDTIAKW